MVKCRWLKPQLIATIDYLERTRRESPAAPGVRGTNRQIGESQPVESFAFPTDDLKLIAMLAKEKRRATWSLV
jgi:hypothetical protein